MTRPVRVWPAAALAGAVLLAGCSAPRELGADAAGDLRAAVARVVAAAEAGDAAGALDAVTGVRAALEQAADDGDVSLDRYRRIDAALMATERELEALLAPGAGADSDAGAADGAEPGPAEERPGPARGGPPGEGAREGGPDHGAGPEGDRGRGRG